MKWLNSYDMKDLEWLQSNINEIPSYVHMKHVNNLKKCNNHSITPNNSYDLFLTPVFSGLEIHEQRKTSNWGTYKHFIGPQQMLSPKVLSFKHSSVFLL